MARIAEVVLGATGRLAQPGGPLELDALQLAAGLATVRLADPAALVQVALGHGPVGTELRVRGALAGTQEGRALLAVAPRTITPMPGLSVVEHLVLAIRLARRLPGRAAGTIAEALGASGLEGLEGVVVEDLGHEEVRRVAVAMALVRPAFARLLWLEDRDNGAETIVRLLEERTHGGEVGVVIGARPPEAPGAVQLVALGGRLVRATASPNGPS